MCAPYQLSKLYHTSAMVGTSLNSSIPFLLSFNISVATIALDIALWPMV